MCNIDSLRFGWVGLILAVQRRHPPLVGEPGWWRGGTRPGALRSWRTQGLAQRKHGASGMPTAPMRTVLREIERKPWETAGLCSIAAQGYGRRVSAASEIGPAPMVRLSITSGETHDTTPHPRT